MSPNLTEILFILDRSGSMAPLTESAISGFNSFLQDQTAQPGLARLTLMLFDDRFDYPVSSLPLPEITPLDATVFIPRGSTALLDAIATGIDDLGKRLASLPENDRPATVIVAILTDGEENASLLHTWDDVRKRIRHQTETYNWHFLYLGANQDAIATAAKAGIHAANSANWTSDNQGIDATSASLARKTKAMRKMHTGQTLDPSEQADLHTSLNEIVREEDDKRRK